MKRVFTFILPIFLAICGTTGCMPEAKAASFTEGLEYGVIFPPLPTQVDKGQVEVAEVFWYGCPHCYNLEPTIETYLKQKPKNVTFSRVPAMLNQWTFHGKLYYVGQLLDPTGSKGVHEKIFAAIHKQRRRIGNDDQMKRFYKGLGFKASEITNAMKSMELKSKLSYAKEITNNSGLDSVPTLIVNGKYLTSPTMAKGKNIIDIIHFLTRMAEKEN